MRRSCSVSVHHLILGALATVSMLVLSCVAQRPTQGPSQTEPLSKFLRGYITVPTQEKETTRYSAAFVDLRDDGAQEAIVYLSSEGWCGTGGCTMLILSPEGTSYRVVTRIPAVRLPIRMLTTKTNGWHDVTVVAGKRLYEAILPFDGKKYPGNASMPPAHPLSTKKAGKVVMSETAEDKRLY